jgi:hypothetical protein
MSNYQVSSDYLVEVVKGSTDSKKPLLRLLECLIGFYTFFYVYKHSTEIFPFTKQNLWRNVGSYIETTARFRKPTKQNLWRDVGIYINKTARFRKPRILPHWLALHWPMY